MPEMRGSVEGKTNIFCATSAVMLILISNLLTMSQGFGSSSIVLQRRPLSLLYLQGRTKNKKFPSDSSNGDEKDENDDHTLLSILPIGLFPDSSNSKATKRKRMSSSSSIPKKGISKRLSPFNNLPDRTVSATGLPQPHNSPSFRGKDNRRSIVSRFDNTNRDDCSSNTRTRSSRSNNLDTIGEGEIPISSLLPPSTNIKSKEGNLKDTEINLRDDEDIQGLSSWEEFLGGNQRQSSSSLGRRETKFQNMKEEFDQTLDVKVDGEISSDDVVKYLLPSIADLFPTDLFTSKPGDQLSETSRTSDNNSNKDTVNVFPTPTLDGVLPVSDLFYRSSQSLNQNDDNSDNNQNNNNSEDGDRSQRDDNELPFSAEQSDQLTSSLNKIKLRRNTARLKGFTASGINNNNNINSNATIPTSKPTKKKKLQRRGMEMLVGGVPINADPPQRCVELTYQHEKNVDWNEVISTNTPDFGPMYYGPSISKLSKKEQGLYCEFFVNSTLRWNVCPKELKSILSKDDRLSEKGDDPRIENEEKSYESDTNAIRYPGTMKESFKKASVSVKDNSSAELSGELLFSMGATKEELESSGDNQTSKIALERVLATGISTSSQYTGFGVVISTLRLSDLGDGTTTISAKFTLTIKNNASMNFTEVKRKCNQINSSLAQALNNGDMQRAMAAAAKKEKAWSEELRNRIIEEFLYDDDDGDVHLEESNTTDEDFDVNTSTTPNKISEAKPEIDLELTIDSLLNDLNYEVQGFRKDPVPADVPFGMPGNSVYHKEDIFLGGGNDGVFWNYAADNAASAPYQGKLGLRLVDAVEEKAKQRHPRVIAIGDVHGCIDELQDLLRECNYRPGDIVVFLGDLVSKGPDSMSVVQMAREIGAIGVRGNHDFEVVRWHQAIKSGVDPPVVGSEHFHIANCLTKADMKWMYSLPWYISSPDLGVLFVHAGFVSGIRLAKQNPRLMMNMRSILPDGTVTSKFFNNWPWARLWDGPQTVLFGHDADRGLQQYEHAIGLDTGCVYGGRLTACILPEKRLVSVNAKREYFKYRRKHYD